MSLPYLQPYLGLSNGLNTLHGGAAGAVGGWVELGRTTLGSAGDSIDVTSLADKRYYMVLSDIKASGTVAGVVRLNNDSGSNYSLRRSANGGADGTSTLTTFMYNLDISTTSPSFNIGYISNLSTKEKLAINHTVVQSTAGAGTAPTRRESVGKHAQTSNPISQINAINVETGDFDTGSEVVVLGYDPADTHTNNFWEELASVQGTGSSTNLSSGTISAKKYLWIQIYVDPASSTDLAVTFNNDTGSNYAIRVSDNGGSDGTSASRTNINLDASITTPTFVNMFVINNSSNEKLCIAHSIEQSTAGAGNAPTRRESANKWANTSSQITEIDVDSSGGNWGSSSIIKVWGAD